MAKTKGGGETDSSLNIDAQVEGTDPATTAAFSGATLTPEKRRVRIRTTDRARYICPLGTLTRIAVERTLTAEQLEQLEHEKALVPLEVVFLD